MLLFLLLVGPCQAQAQAGNYIEGDILVGEEGGGSSSGLSHAFLSNPERLWPNGIVPYKFDDTFTNTEQQDIVRNSMQFITNTVGDSEKTARRPCIRFEDIGDTEGTDYILIRNGIDCSSALGRMGGEQKLNLNAGCFVDGMMTTTHELMHSLGFVHEHTRPDRDDFIKINFDNIEKGKRGNFVKRNYLNSKYFDPKFDNNATVDMANTPYDHMSLMHYGPYDFTNKQGEKVFSRRGVLPEDDGRWPEPQPEDPLSLIDKVELAIAYGCTMHQSRLIKYIHHNRNHNTMLIDVLKVKYKDLEMKVNALTERMGQRSVHCAYKDKWHNQAAWAQVTYSQVTVADGLSTMDASSGLWTAGLSGMYSVNWNLDIVVDNGDNAAASMYKNGQPVAHSAHGTALYNSNGSLQEHAGGSMILELEKGDTLALRTCIKKGGVFQVSLCVHLLYGK